jgi:hypothetical protein
VLRWPGGNFVSGYHWTDGVGPKDARPRKMELAWRSVEPNRFGTDEFMAYCRELGVEPYISINMGTGTLDEAQAWVEYCNGSGMTRFRAALPGRGRWSLRGALQQGFHVPASIAGPHQIHAGRLEGKPGNFDSSAPERTEAQSGRHFVGAQHRFRAEGRIFGDHDVGQIKAGLRQQAQAHGVHRDMTSERLLHRTGDALAIAFQID